VDNSKFLWTRGLKCAEPLAPPRTGAYDASTSEATKTGERREAHRRRGNEAPTRSSTPSWQMNNQRGHAQIDSRADRGRLGKLRRPCRVSGSCGCGRRGAPQWCDGHASCAHPALQSLPLRPLPPSGLTRTARVPAAPLRRTSPGTIGACGRPSFFVLGGVDCVESWGTSWRTKVSCGQAVVCAVGLLHDRHRSIYDVGTSTATKTGELREARGAECEGVERCKPSGAIKEASKRSSTT
jgi:hypothetical protein